MSTLPKVEFKYTSLQGGASYSSVQLYPFGKLGSNPIITVLPEYYAIEVHFECGDDPQAKLVIDCYDTDDNQLELRNGQTYRITAGGDSDDMLVPGDYPVTVTTSTTVYEGIFRIQSASLSFDAIVNLRAYLEKFLTGLAYNLLRRRSGMFTDGMDHVPSVLQTYQHIEKEFRKLKNDLELLFREPIQDVIKEYRERNVSVRPDAKSQRWLVSKGISRNHNIHMPSIVYEKHAALTADTIENRWVKKILIFILHSLRELEVGFLQKDSEAKQVIEMKKQELKHEMDLLEKANRRANPATKRDREKRERDITRLTNEIARREQLLAMQVTIRSRLRSMIATFTRYEQEPWLKALSPRVNSNKPPMRLLKDRRYAPLYRFYKEIKRIQNRDYSNSKATFPYKKNSKLFEYYILALVMQIVEEYGYEGIAGWIFNPGNPQVLIGDLSSGTKIELAKDRQRIEIVYDHEIKRPQDEKSMDHFVPSIHRTPDIRISFYDQNNRHVKTLIVEVKCRRYKYIYDNTAETEAYQQIKNYLDMKYYDSYKDKLDHEAVKKVIAVFPKQDYAPTEPKYLHYNKVIFVPIEPVDPNTGTNPYGYDFLREIIGEFIETVENEGVAS